MKVKVDNKVREKVEKVKSDWKESSKELQKDKRGIGN